MNADEDRCTPFASLDFWGDNLEPTPLLAVIPLKAPRPKRKGDPVGRSRNGKVPVAKVGTCNVFTHKDVHEHDLNVHLRYILDAICPRISEIREIKRAQQIEWRITLFEGSYENEKLKDVDPSLLEAARELGIPVEVEEPFPQ